MERDGTIPASLSINDHEQSRLVDWVIRHQLTLFFVLAFLFSWTIYLAAAQITFENDTTFSRILLIAAYGPSLSAILLSAVAKPGARGRRSIEWFGLFILALALAAGIEWLDHIWWGHRIELSLILADAVLVLLAALTLTGLFTDRMNAHLGSKAAKQGRLWAWILVALAFWPLLVLIGSVIARASGLSVPPNPDWPDFPLPLILLESFFWALLFGGPLNEEPGWRGFALPRLQSRFSPLVASLILGAFWGLWHIPLHLIGVYYGGALGAVIRIQEIPRAILFTWLFNRTKGSLLVVLLFHAAINTTSYFMARSFEVVFILLLIAAISVVFSDKMWRRLPASG